MWALGSVLLVVGCGTLRPAAAGDDCKAYTDLTGRSHPTLNCFGFDFCCGSCDIRTCCSNPLEQLTEDEQDNCPRYDSPSSHGDDMFILIPILIVVSFAIIMTLAVCSACPCCPIYKARRQYRPLVTTTTVVQYPTYTTDYRSISPPVQPEFGNPAMLTTTHEGPACPPAHLPPSYQDSVGAPVPYSHAGYSGGQMAYPLQPPTVPEHLSTQPAYNPAYVDPSKPTY